jgi:hypothetical protein
MRCPNYNLLLSIIQNTIQNTISTQTLEISNHQLQNLHQLLINHECLSFNQTFNSNSLSIFHTLQGFIPTAIIDTIAQHSDSHNTAVQLSTKLISNISTKIHEQLWIPYCNNLAEWKKHNNINIQQTTLNLQPRTRAPYIKNYYTYSCICGLPDQQHSEFDNKCPPLGLARRKIEIWTFNWIKYSTPSNYILNIQI